MKKIIRRGLFLIFIVVFLFSAWQLWRIYSEYKEGRSSYDLLTQYVSFAETGPDSTISAIPATRLESDLREDHNTEAPEISAWLEVDFVQLIKINPDIVGWIYIEGTNINYPVVQGADNDYYLNRLFDGTHNGAGCIFLDYRCASDFSDQHSIIYGHNMKDKSMFSGLMNYKDQAFYEEHSIALLVTPTAYYKIQFFSGYVSEDHSNAWELSLDDANRAAWMKEIQERSCFVSNYIPEPENNIITLSTCSYEFSNARFVLHGYISEKIEKWP